MHVRVISFYTTHITLTFSVCQNTSVPSAGTSTLLLVHFVKHALAAPPPATPHLPRNPRPLRLPLRTLPTQVRIYLGALALAAQNLEVLTRWRWTRSTL